MLKLSSKNNGYWELCRLKREYNRLSEHEKWLFPTELAAELNKMDEKRPTIESAFRVYNAYAVRAQFYHTILCHSINEFSKESFIYNLNKLQATGIFTGKNGQDNFNTVLLAQNGPENFSSMADMGLLTGEDAQANFNSMAEHLELNLDAYYHAAELAGALRTLSNIGLLTGKAGQANREAMACKPKNVTYAFDMLQEAGLLTRENAQAYFNAIMKCECEVTFAHDIIRIKPTGLLTGGNALTNLNAVAVHQNSSRLTETVRLLYRAGLMEAESEHTQTRFENLISYSNILLTKNTISLWKQIPEDALTEAHWNRIIQICRENQVNPEEGRVQFTRYVNRERLHQPQTFNARKSTHTASVHQTVSESAMRLYNRYRNNVGDLRVKLKEIEDWVAAQGEHEVEMHAFQQLAHSPYAFVEERSKITTQMLMALSWDAIHDDSMRMGSLDDAKILFLQGLFDIQRAYNLSHTFENRNEKDKTDCASGTFNKFIEKLVRVHPYAELKYIIKQKAMMKLMPMIRAAATDYLGQTSHKSLTVESLKEAIRPIVREQFFFEYGQAFEALTTDYDSFEDFKVSNDYASFQASFQAEQNDGLELMIDGKLLVLDDELDQELIGLIASHVEAKEVPDEVSDKPTTQEGMRARRRPSFFESQKSQDSTAQRKSREESEPLSNEFKRA